MGYFCPMLPAPSAFYPIVISDGCPLPLGREQIKRLLSEARARREAAVARVRAKREQAKIGSEGELVGQAAVSSTPTSSSSGNVSSLVHHAEPASSSPSAAAMPGEDRRPRGLAAQGPSSTAERGETSRSRPNGVKGDEPPWKGFTLSDGRKWS